MKQQAEDGAGTLLDTGGIDAFAFAAGRPQQRAPNTVGRYRNGDPVLANYLTLKLQAQ